MRTTFASQPRGSRVVIATLGLVCLASLSCGEKGPTPPDDETLRLVGLVLTPDAVTLEAAATQQFTTVGILSNGDSVPGDSVTGVVTYAQTGGAITSDGLYTAGETPGDYEVTASVTHSQLVEGGTAADTSSTTINAPPPPPGAVADPTLLPVATGQTRLQSEYEALDVRGLAAGESYPDPVTGVTIYRLTTPSSPETNSRGVHDYSEGGPFISLPWGPSQEMYSIYFRVRIQPADRWEGYVLDFHMTTGQFSNARSTNVPGGVSDLRFAFSNDPSTPRIAYLSDLNGSSVLDRYDTETMQVANTGNFPHSFPGRSGWLHQDRNDLWFVSSHSSWGMAAWNSQTDTEYTYFPSGFDEPHLDRGGNFVAIKRARHSPEDCGSSSCVRGNLDIMDLSDGSIDATRDLSNSHPASLIGYFVFVYPHGKSSRTPQRRVDADGSNRTDIIAMPNYVGTSGHRAGQWVVNNDAGTSQWYLASHYAGGTSPGASAIVLVRADGSDVRFLAHHYSNTDGAGSYLRQPHATISPDGRLVMWTSDMNNPSGGARVDVFLAIVPAR